jgi:hypothetical protein
MRCTGAREMRGARRPLRQEQTNRGTTRVVRESCGLAGCGKRVWDGVASAVGSDASRGDSGASSAHRSRLAVLVDGQSVDLAGESSGLALSRTACVEKGNAADGPTPPQPPGGGALARDDFEKNQPVSNSDSLAGPRAEAFARGRTRRLQSFYRTLLGRLASGTPPLAVGSLAQEPPFAHPLFRKIRRKVAEMLSIGFRFLRRHAGRTRDLERIEKI